LKTVLKLDKCKENDVKVIPVEVIDDKKKDIKLRKKVVVKAEKDDDEEKNLKSIETKLDKVIEHHSEIGEVLEGLKE